MSQKTPKKPISKAYQYHQNLVDELHDDGQFDFVKIDKLRRHSPFASFRWAFRGLYYAYRTQRNFRIELFCAVITVAFAIFFQIGKADWSIILFSVTLVLGAELANTSLEFMVDLYEKKFNYLAMMAKDIAATVVLLSAIHAVIQGFLIFGPYFWALLKGWF